jgi:hypothetical protein
MSKKKKRRKEVFITCSIILITDNTNYGNIIEMLLLKNLLQKI